MKNKFAQTLVILFKEEYSGLWSNFFDEMFVLLQKGGLGMVDMFLRIMDTVDESIASRLINRTMIENAKNSQLKDFMRLRVNKNLFEAFYTIIHSFNQSQPNLAKHCLKIVSKFISNNLLFFYLFIFAILFLFVYFCYLFFILLFYFIILLFFFIYYFFSCRLG